jgi:hypothetical protein
MLGRPEPVVTGVGPINRDTIHRYRTMAVMPFVDAEPPKDPARVLPGS